MDKNSLSFSTVKNCVLSIIIFLFPFFFLTLTQEFFITAKIYLLGFGALLLILISTVELLITKKISWTKNPFDNLIILFVVTLGLSVVISSPNKIQAIFNPNFGLIFIISLAIIAFYLSRSTKKQFINLVIISSGFLLSILTIFFFFNPLKNQVLPLTLQFLKNPGFTPLGSQLDLAIFLGFFVIYGLTQILNHKKQVNNKEVKQLLMINYLLLSIGFAALSLTIFKLISTDSNRLQLLSLPPFNLSWYATLETLKNPLTALFGVGIDNFPAVFTKVKDVAYNQTNLWQIPSFSVSRSAILHIFTETGIFGITSFVLLLIVLVKQALYNKQYNWILNIGYWILISLLFPPSLPLFFLFFLILSIFHEPVATDSNYHKPIATDLTNLIPFYLGTIIVVLLFIGASGYFLGRSFAAEYYYKKSLNAYTNNNLQELYNNMKQAINLNPYIERFRINFSQINLLLANNVAAKNNDKYQLTDQDRQNISQAIQAAITEAKVAVSLNSQKAGNWENLGFIYRNILGIAKGADALTIAAYQRAIILDPQNPVYRLNLGGIYYSFNNFDTATNLFEQATAIKPDWANAHYNLAWGNYMKQKYDIAAAEMQNVLYLLNPQKDQADYDKAQKDLEEFKKKLPEAQKQIEPEKKQESKQLTLPTPPDKKIEPPIELPKEASPEAR